MRTGRTVGHAALNEVKNTQRPGRHPDGEGNSKHRAKRFVTHDGLRPYFQGFLSPANKTMAHPGTSMPQNRCIMFLLIHVPGGWRIDHRKN
ncbi:hypothetical protein SBADM41S_05285 [Streptomyces badius]